MRLQAALSWQEMPEVVQRTLWVVMVGERHGFHEYVVADQRGRLVAFDLRLNAWRFGLSSGENHKNEKINLARK